MSPEKRDAIMRACACISDAAHQISEDAKDGCSPLNHDDTPGMWLRDLENQLFALKEVAK